MSCRPSSCLSLWKHQHIWAAVSNECLFPLLAGKWCSDISKRKAFWQLPLPIQREAAVWESAWHCVRGATCIIWRTHLCRGRLQGSDGDTQTLLPSSVAPWSQLWGEPNLVWRTKKAFTGLLINPFILVSEVKPQLRTQAEIDIQWEVCRFFLGESWSYFGVFLFKVLVSLKQEWGQIESVVSSSSCIFFMQYRVYNIRSSLLYLLSLIVPRESTAP